VAHKIKIEQRFYDEAPLFRGYIFGDDKEYREAYIWIFEWKEDSILDSPYVGFGQPLFHITDKTVEGKKMLEPV